MRVRAAGAVSIAVLSILTMLVLAAGLSPKAARMLAHVPAFDPSARAPAPPAAAALSHAPLEPRTPEVILSTGTGDDDSEPAIARAAEAGLQRMRVQFAQTMITPAHPGIEGYAGFASPLSGATVESPSRAAEAPSRANEAPPRAAGTAGDERDVAVHDVRDPRARAEGRDAPPPRPDRTRVIALPSTGDATRMPLGEVAITWIGDATVLVRAHGFTVLADPNFLRRGEVARLGWGRAAPRRADPALPLEALPRIDAVLVSRLRDDRFDRILRRTLPRDVPIVAPQHARAELVAMGFSSVHALAPWQSVRLVRDTAWLQVTATPTDAGPSPLASLVAAAQGALVEFGREGAADPTRVWISGETAAGGALADELARRLGDVDLAVLQVGGHGLPLLSSVGTLDEAGARRLAARISPRHAVALRLDDHGDADAPIAGLQAGVAGPVAVAVPDRGATLRLVPPQRWASIEFDSMP